MEDLIKGEAAELIELVQGGAILPSLQFEVLYEEDGSKFCLYNSQIASGLSRSDLLLSKRDGTIT